MLHSSRKLLKKFFALTNAGPQSPILTITWSVSYTKIFSLQLPDQMIWGNTRGLTEWQKNLLKIFNTGIWIRNIIHFADDVIVISNIKFTVETLDWHTTIQQIYVIRDINYYGAPSRFQNLTFGDTKEVPYKTSSLCNEIIDSFLVKNCVKWKYVQKNHWSSWNLNISVFTPLK